MPLASDPPDLKRFARHIGIPDDKNDLLWIAEEALNAPLPQNWAQVTGSDGSVYFYNSFTDVSTRKHPLEDYYSALYLRVKSQELCREDLASNKAADHAMANTRIPLDPLGADAEPEPEPIEPSLSAPPLQDVELDHRITPQHMIEMAEYLYVDLATEPHLLPLIYEALVAPVPAGWEECQDSNGRAYFYHAASDRSQRAHPGDEQLRLFLERARQIDALPRSECGAWMRFKVRADRADGAYYNVYVDLASQETRTSAPVGFVDVISQYRSAYGRLRASASAVSFEVPAWLRVGNAAHDMRRHPEGILQESVKAPASRQAQSGVPVGIVEVEPFLRLNHAPVVDTLEFVSWWNHGNQRRYIQIKYSIAQRRCSVVLDKTLTFVDQQIVRYTIAAKAGKVEDMHALEAWDLYIGLPILVLGKRATLQQASAQTINWLDYHACRLVQVIHRLENELLKFTSFAPKIDDEYLAKSKNVKPGSRSIRALLNQALGLQKALAAYRPGLSIISDFAESLMNAG
jgi:hypothetical protein